MKSTGEQLTYQIESAKFRFIKKDLNGIIFWREEGTNTIIRFISQSWESYFLNKQKQTA